MSERTSPVSKSLSVVVGLDFSAADGPAFDQSARLVRGLPRGQLHLVHVFDAKPPVAGSGELVAHLRFYVNEKATRLDLGGVIVGIHLRTGKIVLEIVELANEVGADLIVVGSHGRPHLKQWIIGSTAERLIDVARFPVLVASHVPFRPEGHGLAIEPPCPQCHEVRSSTYGAEWWCAHHGHRFSAAHTFSYQRELPLAFDGSEIIPAGIDPGS
jgi:nucleotide-binding universal stress UspA family protein